MGLPGSSDAVNDRYRGGSEATRIALSRMHVSAKVVCCFYCYFL